MQFQILMLCISCILSMHILTTFVCEAYKCHRCNIPRINCSYQFMNLHMRMAGIVCISTTMYTSDLLYFFHEVKQIGFVFFKLKGTSESTSQNICFLKAIIFAKTNQGLDLSACTISKRMPTKQTFCIMHQDTPL